MRRPGPLILLSLFLGGGDTMFNIPVLVSGRRYWNVALDGGKAGDPEE